MTKQQQDILKKAIGHTLTQEDYVIAKELEELMLHPGWAHFKKISDDTKLAIWSTMQGARKEDNVWRLMGMMEGHELAMNAALKFLKFMKENDQQTEIHANTPSELDHVLEGIRGGING